MQTSNVEDRSEFIKHEMTNRMAIGGLAVSVDKEQKPGYVEYQITVTDKFASASTCFASYVMDAHDAEGFFDKVESQLVQAYLNKRFAKN